MHDEIASGSMSTSHTRSGGALKRYEPKMSMPICLPSSERVQMYCQVREIRQCPDGQKVIDKRQCRLEPAGERGVPRRTEQRTQPDQAMSTSLKPGDLRRKLGRVAAVPSVGDQ